MLRDTVLLFSLGAVVLLFSSTCFSSPVAPLNADDACPFPNGSETKMHTYECADGEQITISDINVTDINGNPMYPMDPKQTMVLDLISYNHGESITDNKVDVSIYAYTRSPQTQQCGWTVVPTLGLLNNIDGCDFAHNCPLASGPLSLKIPLDLSQFASIINMLAGNKPYQLNISMKNFNQGNVKHEQIACVVAQIHLI